MNPHRECTGSDKQYDYILTHFIISFNTDFLRR